MRIRWVRLKRTIPLCAVALAFAAGGFPLATKPCEADGGPNHQLRNLHFGVSGGSSRDASRAFCCGGTFGSLLQAADTTQYILSNNHVLARTDTAASGEDDIQPGLIDVGCRATSATTVGDFAAAPPLGSNVDAAVSQLRSGAMDAKGYIEDIGTISSNVQAPSVNLAVKKSGRTTGLTTGSVQSINASVSVQYQRGCGSGKKFTVSYTNQVVVGGSSFSAGGDSGSLIVTNSSCAQPVALLYAGSSSSTIGNPIGEVLTKVGTALGKTVTFVEGCTAGASQPSSSGRSGAQIGVPDAQVTRATQAMRRNYGRLTASRGVIGIGVGASDLIAGNAAIIVYVDKTLSFRPSLPKQVDRVQVRVVETDPFVAYGSTRWGN